MNFFFRETNYLFVYLIFPAAVIGRRRNYPSSASSHQQLNQPSHYKRFHDYASFSSFSDTSSHHIVRRPSVDTISTYLSSQYRYGGSSRTASSYYAGGSFGGSQDLIDMYGHETDSVFTDEEDHISFQSRRYAIHEFNYVNLFRVFFFREIALIFLCSISNYLLHFWCQINSNYLSHSFIKTSIMRFVKCPIIFVDWYKYLSNFSLAHCILTSNWDEMYISTK